MAHFRDESELARKDGAPSVLHCTCQVWHNCAPPSLCGAHDLGSRGGVKPHFQIAVAACLLKKIYAYSL